MKATKRRNYSTQFEHHASTSCLRFLNGGERSRDFKQKNQLQRYETDLQQYSGRFGITLVPSGSGINGHFQPVCQQNGLPPHSRISRLQDQSCQRMAGACGYSYDGTGSHARKVGTRGARIDHALPNGRTGFERHST